MMKKTVLSFLSLISLFSCSLNETQIIDINSLSNNINALYKKRLPEFEKPIFAAFNNAYKILASENNQIGRNDPKNSDKYFLRAIDSAQETLDVAFFDIDDQGAVDMIINSHKKGVKVRVVTDSDNLRDKSDSSLPRKAIEDLKASGIEIKDDKRTAFMHHKFMIVDNKAVWAGSMNPTTTSMYEHNNNVFYIQSSELAQNYFAEFNRMFEKGQFGFITEPVINPIVKVGDAEIKTYFSPRGGTQQAILEELRKATKSIKFMAFSFTEKNMSQILIEKKKQGLNVEGVFDSCLIDKYSNYNLFRENKILSLKDGNQALLHHKTMIIDDETVITGSYNFSNSAENSNNEDTIIIKSKDFANLYLKEYSKIRLAALTNKDIPPYDHPACNHRVSLSSDILTE
jgi:phosphatidylserine/phosphatidylglycerophosphate/cardiolipin synthase-like enzyme